MSNIVGKFVVFVGLFVCFLGHAEQPSPYNPSATGYRPTYGSYHIEGSFGRIVNPQSCDLDVSSRDALIGALTAKVGAGPNRVMNRAADLLTFWSRQDRKVAETVASGYADQLARFGASGKILPALVEASVADASLDRYRTIAKEAIATNLQKFYEKSGTVHNALMGVNRLNAKAQDGIAKFQKAEDDAQNVLSAIQAAQSMLESGEALPEETIRLLAGIPHPQALMTIVKYAALVPRNGSDVRWRDYANLAIERGASYVDQMVRNRLPVDPMYYKVFQAITTGDEAALRDTARGAIQTFAQQQLARLNIRPAQLQLAQTTVQTLLNGFSREAEEEGRTTWEQFAEVAKPLLELAAPFDPSGACAIGRACIALTEGDYATAGKHFFLGAGPQILRGLEGIANLPAWADRSLQLLRQGITWAKRGEAYANRIQAGAVALDETTQFLRNIWSGNVNVNAMSILGVVSHFRQFRTAGLRDYFSVEQSPLVTMSRILSPALPPGSPSGVCVPNQGRFQRMVMNTRQFLGLNEFSIFQREAGQVVDSIRGYVNTLPMTARQRAQFQTHLQNYLVQNQGRNISMDEIFSVLVRWRVSNPA